MLSVVDLLRATQADFERRLKMAGFSYWTSAEWRELMQTHPERTPPKGK